MDSPKFLDCCSQPLARFAILDLFRWISHPKVLIPDSTTFKTPKFKNCDFQKMNGSIRYDTMLLCWYLNTT